ncbi:MULTISPECIES: hypothetical protein [Phaeobacter]|uniref:hypothetical protein n=1 Tax=Phaeobacter TaxID=302485 RepID=UPI00237F06C2|nr:hypothetical protein [Phaeobacter gallaeciensis]MDE4097805.1 hypothetical protein [Phaeobacter gallaeciensis]MDE4106357.1 hypothetical protein [Phaeobacter gallaeciensis]MDE4111069.1 hypothetical protein [Phaeobacter gallaeciensis]MDE4115282.1 hypothetical protein [Phaeobacter gallaeciensis]MDE4119751.1 hypothetical protein [Phaeobacter gallaeciensis]
MSIQNHRMTVLWRKLWPYAAAVAGLLFCFYPAYLVEWSYAFAEEHGCTLNEGGRYPCIVDGIDHGTELYNAYASGWYLLFTLPFAVGIAAYLLLLVIRDVSRWVSVLRSKES